MKLNGTSYVGLGWRPMEGVVRSCNDLIPPRLPVGKDSYIHVLYILHVHLTGLIAFNIITTGSNPLWQHALSFPAVEGADLFYNQLAGINSSYTPGDKQGTDIGTRKDHHATVWYTAYTHMYTHHTHTRTHTHVTLYSWSSPYGLYRHCHRNGKGGPIPSV